MLIGDLLERPVFCNSGNIWLPKALWQKDHVEWISSTTSHPIFHRWNASGETQKRKHPNYQSKWRSAKPRSGFASMTSGFFKSKPKDKILSSPVPSTRDSSSQCIRVQWCFWRAHQKPEFRQTLEAQIFCGVYKIAFCELGNSLEFHRSLEYLEPVWKKLFSCGCERVRLVVPPGCSLGEQTKNGKVWVPSRRLASVSYLEISPEIS